MLTEKTEKLAERKSWRCTEKRHRVRGTIKQNSFTREENKRKRRRRDRRRRKTSRRRRSKKRRNRKKGKKEKEEEKKIVCWLVGCLTSQQHASVSQGRICTDNFTCCHTEIEAADQTFHLTQSQYTDTGPTSPSADPITPGAWQGSHWSANF